MPLTQLLILDQEFRYQSLQTCIFNLQLENLLRIATRGRVMSKGREGILVIVQKTCRRWEFALHPSSLSLVCLVIDKDEGARAAPSPDHFFSFA
jgi:hypothetical protein